MGKGNASGKKHHGVIRAIGERENMDYRKLIGERHSVRAYEDRPLSDEIVAKLEDCIEKINSESGLHIQLIRNEPRAFDSALAHYGHFSGVSNYIALIGRKSPDLDERCGYFGEKIVLEAQGLGLNTCWVALTYKRIPGVFRIGEGEKLTVVIAVGYGKTQGNVRRSKSAEEVSNCRDESPDWFKEGVKAALLAPTATNQQKFFLQLCDGGKVRAKAGFGPYAKMDLGIVKCHFEIGSGKTDIWC